MYDPLNEFAKSLRKRRNEKGMTQKGLAAKLSMSHRTVMDAEGDECNPRFETVILLARELGISLDALVFPETASPNAVHKCVYDYFKDKSETESKKLIDLCRSIEALLGGK